MKISGRICAQALRRVLDNIKAGITGLELDKIAKREIERMGATSSFMTVDGYKWTICTTVNEEVVHGIPNNRPLKIGDILGIDIGALYQGFHSDMAITVPVGKVLPSAEKFLAVGKKTLEKAISFAKVGSHIGDISATIQKNIESVGYSVVESLTGHGIGRNLHEDPIIPGVGNKGIGPEIMKNMVLAIEVIYTHGSGEVKMEKDNWTITSSDSSLAGLFEKTVAVTKDGPIVLTPYL